LTLKLANRFRRQLRSVAAIAVRHETFVFESSFGLFFSDHGRPTTNIKTIPANTQTINPIAITTVVVI
jgi:hypothetical protein